MKQRHKKKSGGRKPLSYRLPEGFMSLREDLGDYLRAKRKASSEFGDMSQEHFAAELGVSRETLSRIDNDTRWPALATLERYLGLLEIELDEVAHKGTSSRPPIPSYPDVCHELGAALDDGRKQKNLTLRQLSEQTEISCAQLSRLTRGHFKGGRHVKVQHVDGTLVFDNDTKVWFTHPVLDYLSVLGGYRRDLGQRSY